MPERPEDLGEDVGLGGGGEIDPVYASRFLATIVFDSLLPFVPTDRWFGDLGSSTVLVKVFRAHKVPLDWDPPWPAIADYGRVRAVFDRLDLHYPEVYARFHPDPALLQASRPGCLLARATGEARPTVAAYPHYARSASRVGEGTRQRSTEPRRHEPLLVALAPRHTALFGAARRRGPPPSGPSPPPFPRPAYFADQFGANQCPVR